MKVVCQILAFLSLSVAIGCGNGNPDDKKEKTDLTDAQRFKKEYEDVNGTKSKKGNTYISLDIAEDNPVVYMHEDDVLELDSGIVLFGFPTCPWCRNAIEPLLDFAKTEGETIYYVNIADIRDQKELQADSSIVTTSEGTKGYRALLEKFGHVLDPYKGLGQDSIKRIVSSTVVFIKDKRAFDKKSGTVDSQEDPYVKLTADQHKELKDSYTSILVKSRQ